MSGIVKLIDSSDTDTVTESAAEVPTKKSTVLYMYYMYKIFIIFLLAENNFKDNFYYYYINCLYSMSWNFPKIAMAVVTLSHILFSIVNMPMCLMACELISLNTRKVVCNNIDLVICFKCKIYVYIRMYIYSGYLRYLLN